MIQDNPAPTPPSSWANTDFEQLWREKRFEDIIDQGTILLQTDTKDPFLCMQVGRALAVLHSPDAEGYLREVLKHPVIEPDLRGWALNYLGKTCFKLGRNDEAKDFLQECIMTNADDEIGDDAKKYFREFGFSDCFTNWRTIQTKSFLFHFPEQSEVKDTALFATDRQQAFDNINRVFRVTLPKLIDFFVWNSIDEAKGCGFKNVGYSIEGYYSAHVRHNQTAGHEMTHILLAAASGYKCKSRFIHEGTAVCFDQSGRDQLSRLRSAISEMGLTEVVKVEDVWRDFNSVPDVVSYPLSGAFVKSLIAAGGEEVFREFVKTASDYESAINIYGDGILTVIAEMESKEALFNHQKHLQR